MQCVFCGHELTPGLERCPRCGGASAPTGQVFTSAPSPYAVAPSATPSFDQPPRSHETADPEVNLHTALVSLQDRQEAIETKLVEAPPPTAAPVVAEKKGLPDSRVARGVEDSLVELKRISYRLGRIGRLALYGHALVILGCVAPWFYVAHQGYTPGIESWGGLPLGLSLASIGMLLWRFRPRPTQKAMPVLVHLLLVAALILVMVWRYRVSQTIGEHLRPELAFGFYLTALGGLGAFLGALIGLKDLR